MVSIRDTGSGIPKEHLAKIFDAGFTTKGVGVGVGSGIWEAMWGGRPRPRPGVPSGPWPACRWASAAVQGDRPTRPLPERLPESRGYPLPAFSGTWGAPRRGAAVFVLMMMMTTFITPPPLKMALHRTRRTVEYTLSRDV